MSLVFHKKRSSVTDPSKERIRSLGEELVDEDEDARGTKKSSEKDTMVVSLEQEVGDRRRKPPLKATIHKRENVELAGSGLHLNTSLSLNQIWIRVQSWVDMKKPSPI